MKSTAVLLAICTIAVFAAKSFDCEGFIPKSTFSSTDDINSTTCCTDTKKTCASEYGSGGSMACPSDWGFEYDGDKASEEDPSWDKCCKRTSCGLWRREGSYDCPKGKQFKLNPLGTGFDDDKCCEDFKKTCANTKDVGGTGTDIVPFSCPAGKQLDEDEALNETVTADVCCIEIPDFTPTCQRLVDNVNDEFDCYALGKQFNEAKAGQTTRDETCCEPFVSTCSRPLASEPFPYQCPNDMVYHDSAPSNGLLSDDKCCKDPTCDDARDATCAEIDCDDDEERTNLAIKSTDSNICCKKKASTSSSAKRKLAYSIFILAAISASLA